MTANSSRRPVQATPATGPGQAGAGSPVRHVLWYWAPLVLYMAVIFAGSSFSHLPDIPGGFSDKTAHACEYAVLGVLFARALAGRRWLSPTLLCVVTAVSFTTLYGVSDEFHQRWVPGRDFDVRDMMADAFGASMSTGALWAWGIIRRFSGFSAGRLS